MADANTTGIPGKQQLVERGSLSTPTSWFSPAYTTHQTHNRLDGIDLIKFKLDANTIKGFVEDKTGAISDKSTFNPEFSAWLRFALTLRVYAELVQHLHDKLDAPKSHDTVRKYKEQLRVIYTRVQIITHAAHVIIDDELTGLTNASHNTLSTTMNQSIQPTQGINTDTTCEHGRILSYCNDCQGASMLNISPLVAQGVRTVYTISVQTFRATVPLVRTVSRAVTAVIAAITILAPHRINPVLTNAFRQCICTAILIAFTMTRTELFNLEQSKCSNPITVKDLRISNRPVIKQIFVFGGGTPDPLPKWFKKVHNSASTTYYNKNDPIMLEFATYILPVTSYTNEKETSHELKTAQITAFNRKTNRVVYKIHDDIVYIIDVLI